VEWVLTLPKSSKCSSVTVAETLEASQVSLGCEPDTEAKKGRNAELPNLRASADSAILEVSEEAKAPISKTSISIDHFYSIYISLPINLLMPDVPIKKIRTKNVISGSKLCPQC
jgi:hypothetical protein